MGREKKMVGAIGEQKALELLKREGYRIIGTNVRTASGELDAVARSGDALVFVEVKTRLSASLGPPSLSVTWAKRRSLVNNALSYLNAHGCAGASSWRIDVVSVKLNADYGVEYIEIIRNAVEDNS